MRYIFVLITLLISAVTAHAQVQVKGYYRSDGTYVAPHIRSSPDSHKWNNYGPSSSSPLYTGRGSITPPSTRDSDKDGIANLYDYDDNNNGVGDDFDLYQYRQGRQKTIDLNSISRIAPVSRSSSLPLNTDISGQTKTQISIDENLKYCSQTDNLSLAICDPTRLSEGSLTKMDLSQIQRIKQRCNNNFSAFNFNKTCNYNSLPISQIQRKELVALELKQNLDRCSKTDNLSLTICDPTQLTAESLEKMPTMQLQRIKRKCDNNFNFGLKCDYGTLPVGKKQREKLQALEIVQNLERCSKTDNLSLALCDPSQLTKSALAQMPIEQIERIKRRCNSNPFGLPNSTKCSF